MVKYISTKRIADHDGRSLDIVVTALGGSGIPSGNGEHRDWIPVAEEREVFGELYERRGEEEAKVATALLHDKEVIFKRPRSRPPGSLTGTIIVDPFPEQSENHHAFAPAR